MSETVICGKLPERLQSGTFIVPCPVPCTSSANLIQAVSASSLNLWPSEARLRHLRWPELPQELCLGNFHLSFPSLGEFQRMLGVGLWRTHLLTLLRDSFWGCILCSKALPTWVQDEAGNLPRISNFRLTSRSWSAFPYLVPPHRNSLM